MDVMVESSVESVDTKGADCKVKIKTKAGEKIIDAEIVLICSRYPSKY
jgi:dihydrolipoamide dehydrogenase